MSENFCFGGVKMSKMDQKLLKCQNLDQKILKMSEFFLGHFGIHFGINMMSNF